ncbi:MAG: PEGA domain-containing protein [Myxococcota bacterium]
MHLSAVLTILMSIAVLAGDARAQAKPSIAVLGLEVVDEGAGIDAKTTKLARDLTDSMRDRAKQRSSPYRLAPSSDKDLAEMKLLAGCSGDRDLSCLGDIGKQFNADFLIFGKVSKKGGGFSVVVNLLDVSKEVMKRSIPKTIKAQDAGRSSRIKGWGRDLYNGLVGIPDEGILVITANVKKGAVYVDGEAKGSLSSSTARIVGLRVGNREVEIRTDGYRTYRIEVDIEVKLRTSEVEGIQIQGPNQDEDPVPQT